MSPLVWLVAIAITAGAAAVQGTVGVGFAMIAVPVLSLVNPDLAPVPQLIAAVPLTVAMAWRERRSMDLNGVGWIIAGRFPGLAIGVVLLASVTQRSLDLFIGCVVLGAVVVIATGFHIRRNAATKFGAGVVAGTTGLVASIGGPPIALIYTSEEASTIRSTLAAVFTIGLALGITTRVVTGNITALDVRVGLILIPAVIGGYLVSMRYKDSIPRHAVRMAILTISAISAVALIGRAIAG